MCLYLSPAHLSSTAELHWPWPPAGPAQAGPESAGTARVYRRTMCVFVCLPGLTIWKAQTSVWPESPSGGVTGDRKAPSRLVCSAKA